MYLQHVLLHGSIAGMAAIIDLNAEASSAEASFTDAQAASRASQPLIQLHGVQAWQVYCMLCAILCDGSTPKCLLMSTAAQTHLKSFRSACCC